MDRAGKKKTGWGFFGEGSPLLMNTTRWWVFTMLIVPSRDLNCLQILNSPISVVWNTASALWVRNIFPFVLQFIITIHLLNIPHNLHYIVIRMPSWLQ